MGHNQSNKLLRAIINSFYPIDLIFDKSDGFVMVHNAYLVGFGLWA